VRRPVHGQHWKRAGSSCACWRTASPRSAS
jgi:hypothetical protein